MFTVHGCLAHAVLCGLLFLQFVLQQASAQAPPCSSTTPICAPFPGDSWTEGSIKSVIWNPKIMSPFGQYDRVDMYIADDVDTSRHVFLQGEVDLNIGVMAVKLEAVLFPEDLPVNRSCHLVLTKNGDALDGTHATLNSSSFFMIRNTQTINGTVVPILPTTATATALPTSATSLSTTRITSAGASTTTGATSSLAVAPPSSTLPTTSEKTSALSPLVITLISVGSTALVIAMIALGLLYRTRRRFKGNTGHFKSLHDHPNSPTDGISKSSMSKSEEGDTSFVGPTFSGGALTGGRNSYNTVRSAEPMIKGAPSMLGYNQQQPSPSSPTAPVPLLERNSSTLRQVPESSTSAAEAVVIVTPAEVGDGEGDTAAGTGSMDSRQGRHPSLKEPVLTTGDAQLIAETFRKSMRKPRWEDEDEDEDEDEARRAAKELLRKELSEEGVDVQRGVQRRVTIRDRPHRSSLAPPVSQSVSMPEP